MAVIMILTMMVIDRMIVIDRMMIIIVTMTVIDWMVIMIVTMTVNDWMVKGFCDQYLYMRRIIHQRNSFNNYHRMIGRMEDKERERQQRAWDAWRAEQNEAWRRQEIRATNRSDMGLYQKGNIGN